MLSPIVGGSLRGTGGSEGDEEKEEEEEEEEEFEKNFKIPELIFTIDINNFPSIIVSTI